MRVHIGLPWSWGREIHPFCGDALLHIGFLHLSWRMTARDYARFKKETDDFWQPEQTGET
jgi:hypothetical protein